MYHFLTKTNLQPNKMAVDFDLAVDILDPASSIAMPFNHVRGHLILFSDFHM